ncbi:MAG TPA: hypothetical protein VJ747_05715 [Stellaceae bacterium]|nr:hypothetical protein [Stellaceae bacterium]
MTPMRGLTTPMATVVTKAGALMSSWTRVDAEWVMEPSRVV